MVLDDRPAIYFRPDHTPEHEHLRYDCRGSAEREGCGPGQYVRCSYEQTGGRGSWVLIYRCNGCGDVIRSEWCEPETWCPIPRVGGPMVQTGDTERELAAVSLSDYLTRSSSDDPDTTSPRAKRARRGPRIRKDYR